MGMLMEPHGSRRKLHAMADAFALAAFKVGEAQAQDLDRIKACALP